MCSGLTDGVSKIIEQECITYHAYPCDLHKLHGCEPMALFTLPRCRRPAYMGLDQSTHITRGLRKESIEDLRAYHVEKDIHHVGIM